MENASIFISVGSLAISALAYYRQTERAQHKLIKNDALRTVAARAVVVWEQMQNIMFCLKYEKQLDPYFFPSYQLNIQRLEKAIDKAISVGCFEELVTTKSNALTYHAVFIQGLVYVKSLDIKEMTDLNEWINKHFLLGMARLVCQCQEQGLISKQYSAALQGAIKLKDEACEYMEKQP